jgi:hypothetical protein
MSTESTWVVSVNDGAGWRTSWDFKKKRGQEPTNPRLLAHDFARGLVRGHPNLEPYEHVKVTEIVTSTVIDKGWYE